MKETARGSSHTSGMSDPKQDRDSDRDSLTGWTLVDHEGTPEDTTQEDVTSPPDGDEAEGGGEEEEEEEEEEEAEEESGCGMGEDVEDEESLPDDLVTMGQKVQEIKGESIKEEGDVESLASTDMSVLDEDGKEKPVEEETDLSLASSPSLPDDLPAMRPDTQYKHTPDRDLNSRLNVVVALTLACVLGLGLGHFHGLLVLSEDGGWSSRTMWQENLNSAQIIEALTTENRNMGSEITRLQQQTIAPIKIGGKDGKMARDMRERINHLILDNEELRMAIGKLQFASVPEGDKEAFDHALKNNYNLRIAVSKLMHLGPNLNDLKVSANDLQVENQELQIQVGRLRYQQQPLPQELNAVAREIENMKKTVNAASKQKKVPPSLEDSRIYVTYMSQILSGIQTLHEFGESGFFEKVNVATDVFEGLVPGNVKLPPATQKKMDVARTKFNDIRVALSKKWEKVKELSQPESVVDVGRDTLTKMNRVIVNVVNKMKEIGQSSIMNRGKTSVEKTITTLAERFSALGAQFDKTWDSLEDETITKDGEENVASIPAVSEEETLSPEPVQMSSVTQEVEEEEEVVAVEETVEEEEVSEGELDAEEAQPIVATSGRGNKNGGDGGDKRKKPEDKKNKKASKKEEKKKEKKEDKQERKHQKSRRNRIRSNEEKKEKEDKAAGKQKELKKNDNKKARQEEEKKKGRSQNKHDNSRDATGSSQRHDKDKISQEENKKYYKGQYNKYDKKRHHSDDDDNDDDDDDRDSHHYKNKYKKKNGYDNDDDDDDDFNKHRKKHQSKHGNDDGDDDDDDGSSQLKRHKERHGDNDEDKQKGLKRHWQQPSRKNHHREFTGPKKSFIRRRGKNQTQPYYHTQQREWASKRAEGRVRGAEEQKSDWMFDRARDRSQRRENEQKADWHFDRARERSNKRDREQVADWHFDRARERSNKREREREADWQFDRAKDRSNRREKDLEADWQFDRAQGRKEMRYVDKDHDRYGHDKYENHEGKRRYIRFYDDDDDDDDDDEYEEYDDGDYYRYHQHQNQQGKMKYNQRKKEYLRKKGQREWVIPNLSASGKAFYR